MAKEIYNQALLGDIVTEDFRTAEIFIRAGIDFCCGGKKTLEQACMEKNVDQELLIKELKELKLMPANTNHNFKDWGLDFLADYIINVHHKYVFKTLPDLVSYTKKIASVHSSHHPELIEVSDLFTKVNTELENNILYPQALKL